MVGHRKEKFRCGATDGCSARPIGRAHEVFSSESVTEGHPDKMCDQISDALLDAFLAGDKGSRCAIESLSAGNMIHVAGEVTSATDVDVEGVVRDLVRSIGYTDQSFWYRRRRFRFGICR